MILPSSKSRSDGTYLLSGLPAGSARGSVYAADLPERMDMVGPSERCVDFEVNLKAGVAATTDFEFTPGTAIVEGYVAVDGQSTPKSDVNFWVTTPVGKERFNGETDEEGVFRFRDVPAGSVEMKIRAGGLSETTSFSLEDNETHALDFDLR